MNLLSAFLIVAFFIFCFALCIKNIRAGVLLAVFVLPWRELYVDAGLTVTAYLIVSGALLLVTVLRILVKRSILPEGLPWALFLIYVLYSICVSIFHITVLPSDVLFIGGAGRQPLMRAVFQLLLFGLTIAPVLFITANIRDTGFIHEMGKVYVKSVFFLSLLGSAQVLIWYSTGRDILPIGLFNSLFQPGEKILRSGIFQLGNLPIFRMSSLGGEPKFMGQSLSVALLLLQAWKFYSIRVGRSIAGRRSTFLWLFLFLCLFLSYSTSAWYLWIIGTSVQFLFFLIDRRKTMMARQNLPVIIVVILLVFTFAAGESVSILGKLTAPVSQIIQMRTTDREQLFVEDFDHAIIQFLKNNPKQGAFGVGLGNAHIYSQKYLPPYSLRYAKDTVFSAKSGYLKVISETGILGLLLITICVLSLAARIMKLKPMKYSDSTSSAHWMMASMLTVLFFLFLARGGYVINQFYMGFGGALMFYRSSFRVSSGSRWSIFLEEPEPGA